MKTIPLNKNVLDVFMDFDTQPTGFEPSCWVRLHKQRGTDSWKQVAGIRLPTHKFQAMLKELPKGV